MASYKFSKKTSVVLRPQFPIFPSKIDSEEILEGYTVDEKGFPFAIVKRQERNQKYWLIVNRFSGHPIVYRFEQKQKAEKFFKKFCELYDIQDIEFRNPLTTFQYKKASFDTKRALNQEEYMKRNYGV